MSSIYQYKIYKQRGKSAALNRLPRLCCLATTRWLPLRWKLRWSPLLTLFWQWVGLIKELLEILQLIYSCIQSIGRLVDGLFSRPDTECHLALETTTQCEV